MPITFSSADRNSSGGYSYSSGTQTGSGSSGGGGSSSNNNSSSSQVSWDEFEAAINAEKALRDAYAGGFDATSDSSGNISYKTGAGTSVQSGSKGITYTGLDGKTYSSQSAADKASAAYTLLQQQIAEQKALDDAAKAAFSNELARTQGIAEDLAAQYGFDAFDITGDWKTGVKTTYTDPFTGQTKTIGGASQFEDILTDSIFENDFNNAIAAEQALEDAYALDAFNITGTKEGGIKFDYIDPFTGEVASADSAGYAENMLKESIAEQTSQFVDQAQADVEQQLNQQRYDEMLLQRAIAAEEEALAKEQQAAQKAADEATRLQQQRALAEESLGQGTLDPLGFLNVFNDSLIADINAPITTIPALPQGTYQNAFGQQFTQSDIDALGIRDTEGNYLVGNVANRVETADGGTGYLIGTGNNAIVSGEDWIFPNQGKSTLDPSKGYNLGRVSDVAQGLISKATEYQTPSMIPVAEDRSIPTIQDALDATIANLQDPNANWYEDPNEATTGWQGAPYKTASQLLTDAIESGEPILDSTFGSIQTTDEFFDRYSRQNLGVPYTEAAMSQYGIGPEGYNNFIGAVEAAKAQGTSFLGNDPDVIIYDTGNLRDPNNGKVLAEDPISFQGFAASIAQAVGNFVIGQIGGQVAGSFVSGLAGGFKAPLYAAYGTRSALQALQPITVAAYVDEFGESYVKSSFFGQDSLVKSSEIKPQEYFESSQGSSDLQSASNIVEAVNTGRAKGWQGYYNGNMSIQDIVTGAVVGNVIGAAEGIKGEFLGLLEKVVVEGMDPITAVVSQFGDNLTANLPEGYDKLTESAARIMVGESPIGVLGEIYGPEVGVEGPLGIAAIKGAVALDTGKSPEVALGIATYHFFKNGGELSDFKVPSFLEGSEVNWPELDLSFITDIKDGITDSVSSVIDFVKSVVPEFSGVDFSGLEIPEMGVGEFFDSVGSTVADITDWISSQMPEIPSVDVAVDVPEIDIDLPEIDFDLPEFDLGLDLALAGAAGGGTGVLPASRKRGVFDPSLIQVPTDGKLLSREVLGRTFKQV